MRLAVGLDGHRRNARIGDLEIVELTQAEAHLVGGAHRGPVRCYYVAFQTRIERTADAREPILLWGVERHVDVRSLFPVSVRCSRTDTSLGCGTSCRRPQPVPRIAGTSCRTT